MLKNILQNPKNFSQGGTAVSCNLRNLFRPLSVVTELHCQVD